MFAIHDKNLYINKLIENIQKANHHTGWVQVASDICVILHRTTLHQAAIRPKIDKIFRVLITRIHTTFKISRKQSQPSQDRQVQSSNKVPIMHMNLKARGSIYKGTNHRKTTDRTLTINSWCLNVFEEHYIGLPL